MLNKKLSNYPNKLSKLDTIKKFYSGLFLLFGKILEILIPNSYFFLHKMLKNHAEIAILIWFQFRGWTILSLKFLTSPTVYAVF